jgi:hypothetical protein
MSRLSATAVELKIADIIYLSRLPNAASPNAVGSTSSPGLCVRKDSQE